MARRKVHWHRKMEGQLGFAFRPPCGAFGCDTTTHLAKVTCKACIKLLEKAGKEIPDPIPNLHLYSPSFSLEHKANGKVQLVITTVEKNPDDLRPLIDLMLERGYDYILPSVTEEDIEAEKKKKAEKKVKKKAKKKKQVAFRRVPAAKRVKKIKKKAGKRAVGGRKRKKVAKGTLGGVLGPDHFDDDAVDRTYTF